VTAVTNGPSAPTDSVAGAAPVGDAFSGDMPPHEELRSVETDVFAGLVIGSVEGALAADAFADPGRPEDDHAELGRPSHLRVAPDVQRGLFDRRRRAQLLVLGVAAISAASMFMLVTFHVFAAQSAFTLDKLNTQLANEQRQYEKLRDRVATLSSPEAVANRATSIGMIRAPGVTVLHPFVASPFNPTAGVPVPPPTPYSAVDNIGQ
jgi:cell division protein FtsL